MESGRWLCFGGSTIAQDEQDCEKVKRNIGKTMKDIDISGTINCRQLKPTYCGLWAREKKLPWQIEAMEKDNSETRSKELQEVYGRVASWVHGPNIETDQDGPCIQVESSPTQWRLIGLSRCLELLLQPLSMLVWVNEGWNPKHLGGTMFTICDLHALQ